MADVLCRELIGRDSEFRVLGAALRAALGGAGGLAFVIGEPGIGKSRLARELAAQASRQGAVVVTGRATPSGAGTAYRPLTEAIAQALRDRPFPADDSLAPWLPALGAIVPAVPAPAAIPAAAAVPAAAAGPEGGDDQPMATAASAQDRDAASPAGGQAAISAAARGEATVLLLRSLAAGRGLLVVLEDLHWADPDTLAVVEYLADNLAGEPVLCLATCRSEPRSPALELAVRLRSRRCGIKLDLVRLDDSQVGEMARACLPGVADDVVDRLRRTADGVPFLVEELLASPGVPASFADTVRERIAVLSDDDRLVLDAAAVLGRSFDYALLPGITGLGAGQVASALELGVTSLLLAADGTGFRFRHALTREALAVALLPPRRSALAARALDMLGAAGPGSSSGGWLDLAADLSAQSGRPVKAALFLAESARQSLRQAALATATATLERAAGLLAGAGQDPGTRAASSAVDTLLLEALALAGRVDEAFVVGDRLIVEAEQGEPADPVSSVRVLLRLAYAAVAATRWPAAAGRLAAARRLLATDPQPRLAAEAAVLEAEVALADDDLERARALAAEVLSSPEAEPEAVCRSHALVGRIERVGDLEAARRAFERALAVADAAGLPLWRLHALHELGTIEIFDHVGVARLTQARAAASELGALSTLAVIDLQLAITYTWRLDLDRGAEHARLASDVAGRLGLGEVWTKAQFSLAENCATRGQREEMERFLAALVLDAPGERYLEGFAWGCRGMAELLQGDWPGALRRFERGTALLAVLPPAEPSQFRAWWPLLLAMTGDERAAGECAQARACGVAVPRPNRGLLGYADAVIAGRAGRAGQAARLADQADADLGVVPVLPHLARLCAAGPALADGWGEPRQWLAAALDCFAAQGLDGLAARCRDLLDLAEPGRRTWLDSLGITAREADVLGLVAQGLSNKDIAARLFLSPRTVEKHVESLLRKTGARSRTQLAVSGTQVRAR